MNFGASGGGFGFRFVGGRRGGRGGGGGRSGAGTCAAFGVSKSLLQESGCLGSGWS